MNRTFALSPAACLFHADARDALKALPADSLDSCVTDPPYALVSIVKRFGGANAAPAKGNEAYMRASAGFMGKQWDTGECAMDPAFWSEVYRVLKPGAFLAAFGATRGYHRMACAIEDAGFEIRDSLMWVYGSGFPKSHDVSKGIDGLDAVAARLSRRYQFTEWLVSVCPLNGPQMDTICQTNTMGRHWTDCRPSGKQPDVPTREFFEMLRPHVSGGVPAWVEAMVDERTIESENMKRREVVGVVEGAMSGWDMDGGTKFVDRNMTKPHTPAALEWQGWGTALKPAFEPIVLARKPLSEGTVAANVLKWRTGAINIDGCRVSGDMGPDRALGKPRRDDNGIYGTANTTINPQSPLGRWPANVVTDGSDEVVGCFPVTSGGTPHARGGKNPNPMDWGNDRADGHIVTGIKEPPGSAARFFYSAKASKADRNGSKHPTVKPIALMQWLARLITPPGGTILDPFAGSGTTGAAAALEGFNCVLVEREAEYVADIVRRLHI